jgi:hypothetical protein
LGIFPRKCGCGANLALSDGALGFRTRVALGRRGNFEFSVHVAQKQIRIILKKGSGSQCEVDVADAQTDAGF